MSFSFSVCGIGCKNTPSYAGGAAMCKLGKKSDFTLPIKGHKRNGHLFSRTIGSCSGQLVRQFDPVGMLLIALVLFRQNFFQPLGLLFCDPLIYRVWAVANEEFLPATVTPERSHFLE